MNSTVSNGGVDIREHTGHRIITDGFPRNISLLAGTT
jgi:hypothetical protein